MADKLGNVKDFLVSTGLHGFGMRAFQDFNKLGEEYKYLFNFFVPGLHTAILADDPRFVIEEHANGTKTEAGTTEAVEAFIADIERDQVAFGRTFLRYSNFYTFLFVDDGPGIGGPLPDLIRAFQTDNPEWRNDGSPEESPAGDGS